MPRAVKRKNPLDEALTAVRVALMLRQYELAALLGVDRTTLKSWEYSGEIRRTRSLGIVRAWALTLAPELGLPVLRAIGAAPPAPPPQPAPTPPKVTPEAARRLLDDAVHAMAETLDVGPRTLRRALGKMLAAVGESGVGVEAARGMVEGKVRAETKAKKR